MITNMMIITSMMKTCQNSQEYDYYGHQNLLAPAAFPIPPPPLIPPPPPPPPQPGNNIKHNCLVGTM